MQITRSMLAVLVAGSFSIAHSAPVVVTGTGGNAAAIQPSVQAFQSALGTLNPNVAGSLGTGRREINWDGVPDAFSAPNALPANFFNANSPRGVVFGTPGTGFQVSANAASGAGVEFSNINPSYSALFSTFSPQRLFTALGSTITDVNFFVPGSGTAASTSAFGAVFTDVDLPNVTSLQFFDPNGGSLGTFFVPPSTAVGGNEGLSFLGVRFDAGESIGRVRITSGIAALGAGVNETAAIDLVAMDDFIYAEPRTLVAAVPQPGSLALLALGSLGIAASLRRRRA